MEKHRSIQTVSTQDVADRLKHAGILPTQQRLMIAPVLFSRDQHRSADQVRQYVNDDKARGSKATVYNTLGLFASKGLVREVIVDPTRVFYDPNTSNHHHFYNVDTGELRDIEASELAIESLPELPQGTMCEGVDVIIRLSNATETH
mgnify:FL=1